MSNLKTYRINRGITQKQLADMSGVPLSMVQKYEGKFKDINHAFAITVLKLADALGVEVRDLMED